MIKSILIKNFILIEDLFLEFENGFNVLTGETGAGKSIILKAIDTVLGARATKDMILNANEPALIEITFLHSDKDIANLKNLDLGKETVISREMTLTSQKLRVNGALVNLDYVKEIRQSLVDIHNQNQSYTYILPKYHIELLDAYCSNSNSDFLSDINNYKKTYTEFVDVTKKLACIKENNSKNIQEIDFLKFQLNEIDSAEIKQNEEEDLNTELEKLSNIQALKELTYGVHYALSSDEGIIEALSKMKFSLSKALEYDQKLQEAQSSFIEGFENFKFCSDYLRDYSENLENNPVRLDEINERLSLILKLKRKYGDIFETREKLEKRLNEIEGDSSSLDELEARQKELDESIDALAQKISNVRKKYAFELSDKILKELRELELQKAEFEVSIKPKMLDIKGIDDVEFLITTNVSSPLAPLARVASGGEISRVMLAIKTVFAHLDSLSTVIFDEIDTGISGKTSNAVADAICRLSKDMQVFAITHQPIIAARADAHFKVSKKQENQTVVTVEKLVDKEQRLKAIASLASGEVNDISVSFAKELLKY